MTNISNNGIITINRGDNFEAPLYINAGTKFDMIRHILREGEKVYFGVMEASVPFEQSLIRKIYTNEDLNRYGDVVIKLTSEDTEDVVPGMYYYEIKILMKVNGEDYIDTIVPRTKFFIVE